MHESEIGKLKNYCHRYIETILNCLDEGFSLEEIVELGKLRGITHYSIESLLYLKKGELNDIFHNLDKEIGFPLKFSGDDKKCLIKEYGVKLFIRLKPWWQSG